jgi:hypothetical protein
MWREGQDMPSPRDLLLVCYCRRGELASHNLLGALSRIRGMALPSVALRMDTVEVGIEDHLMASCAVAGSPLLDVIVDGELAGRFLGERTTEELETIISEVLAEREQNE